MITVLQKVIDSVKNGSMTTREGAIKVYEAGFTNFIDESYVIRLIQSNVFEKQLKEEITCKH